mmetsp:Transcript_11526/g.19186  ORF Transcript_11526/g.19186 Transcript_11526/m.19186 type:complete len:222 (+) Transcript_11526:495-1160(+)
MVPTRITRGENLVVITLGLHGILNHFRIAKFLLPRALHALQDKVRGRSLVLFRSHVLLQIEVTKVGTNLQFHIHDNLTERSANVVFNREKVLHEIAVGSHLILLFQPRRAHHQLAHRFGHAVAEQITIGQDEIDSLVGDRWSRGEFVFDGTSRLEGINHGWNLTRAPIESMLVTNFPGDAGEHLSHAQLWIGVQLNGLTSNHIHNKTTLLNNLHTRLFINV